MLTNKLPNILLINGPNLNMLGSREPEKYGYTSINDILADMNKLASNLGVVLSNFQSNSEHELIERIHSARSKYDIILINPAAFTHTSVAIRDALLAVNIPFIEIHISNIYARENFRNNSYFSDIAIGVICGFGADGYRFALQMAVKKLFNNN